MSGQMTPPAKKWKLTLCAVAYCVLSLFARSQVEVKPTREILESVVGSFTAENQAILMRRPLFAWESKERLNDGLGTPEKVGRLFRIHEGDFIDFINSGRDETRDGIATIISFKTTRAEISTKMMHEWPLFSVEISVRTKSGHVITGRGSAAGPSYGADWNRGRDPHAIESAARGYLSAVLLALIEIGSKLSRN